MNVFEKYNVNIFGRPYEPYPDREQYNPYDFENDFRKHHRLLTSWRRFKADFPNNAELLEALLGHREAFHTHVTYEPISESKAALLVSLLRADSSPEPVSRLG